MNKYEKAKRMLCEKIDLDMYLPVKEELKGCDCTYSLGIRKEMFKKLISNTIRDLKNSESQMKDISNSEEIEIRISQDGKVVWVNNAQGCVLRMSGLKDIVLVDERRG